MKKGSPEGQSPGACPGPAEGAGSGGVPQIQLLSTFSGEWGSAALAKVFFISLLVHRRPDKTRGFQAGLFGATALDEI